MEILAAACQPVVLALFIGRERYITHTSNSYLFPVAMIRFVAYHCRKLEATVPMSKFTFCVTAFYM